MKNRNKKKYKSRITRKILLNYILSLIGFAVGFILLMMVVHTIVRTIIWQPNDMLYIIFKFVQEYILLFGGIPLFVGWAVITYYFMGQPLRYLDEIIIASEKLAAPIEEQILLSDAMKDVQDEMNQVRETALHNMKLAKEAEQRKNDLVVYLAHDLKTPLTSVIGYITLLHDEKQISEELREKYLSISLEKAEHLEDLINEFFEITRFNLTNITLEYSRVNLTRLLEQLVFEFKPMLLDKKLECVLEAAPDLMLKCDAGKMQRVFDNLLRNAVFYSFENSTIEVSAIQTDTETTIKFINHGNAIPKEKMGRIFEQFYRLDTSRSSNNGGAGLGLAIAREIVDLHHGTIIAASENETIEFCVTLPLS